MIVIWSNLYSVNENHVQPPLFSSPKKKKN